VAHGAIQGKLSALGPAAELDHRCPDLAEIALDHLFEVGDATLSPPVEVGRRQPTETEQYVDRANVLLRGQRLLSGVAYPCLKQKLLAAQRAGLTEVFLPQRNKPELDDVPADVLDAATVHLVSDVSEIPAAAIEPAATAATAAA